MRGLVDALRPLLVPIRREGLPFIAVAVFFAFFVGWFWGPALWLGFAAAVWFAFAFRDPRRVTPLDPRLAVAPADGRVTAVALGAAPSRLGLGEQRRRRLTIAVSPFDGAVARAPLAGTVESVTYKPGRPGGIDPQSEGEDAERNEIILKTAHGRIALVQTAGRMVRRIACFVEQHTALAVGERFGLLRFGAVVDVYFPATARILVAEGQRTFAGETVVAAFDDGPQERRVRID